MYKHQIITRTKTFIGKHEKCSKGSKFSIRKILAAKERNPSLSGIVTHSSGNHGQAVAWASRCVGLPSFVVVPKTAAANKKAAIQAYGAHLIECEPNPAARSETCERLRQEKQLEFIPPYDHPDVIAGQGTAALELLDEVNDLDAILVPTSGGGLISGIAIAAKFIRPSIKVFAVSPKGKMLEDCLRSGERLWPEPSQYLNTIADGIQLQSVGHVTFPILLQLAEKEVFEMSDDEIIQGMRFVFQRMKLVIEAAAGASAAAALSEKMRSMDSSLRKVGVILCGGNTDIDRLPW
ncbi:serine racemase-like isoform X2 [Pomacea canaliculata]|uniref:serine racemase-like isoform X2 n=1 Tax=Pomacea canaliculata TaxID=400727 RepID=UPI000D735BB0|nr:serine racemase-like isoform X2 [Pomacea canaliculata]